MTTIPPADSDSFDAVPQRVLSEDELAANIILALHRLSKGATLYAADNEAAVRHLESARDAVVEYGQQTQLNPKIFFTEKSVFVGGRLLRAGRNVYQSALDLGTLLRRYGIDEVAIGHDVGIDDLRTFQTAVRECIQDGGESPAKASYQRIRLRRGQAPGRRNEEVAPDELVIRTYATATIVMRRFLQALQVGDYRLPIGVRRIAQQLAELSAAESPAFLGTTAVYNAKHEHAGRAVNAALVALAMARQLIDDKRTLARIAMASLMFDVGIPRVAGTDADDLRSGRMMPRLIEEQFEELPTSAAAAMWAIGGFGEAAIQNTVLVYESLTVAFSGHAKRAYNGSRDATLAARIVATSRRFNDMLSNPVAPMTADEAICTMLRAAETDIERTTMRLLASALGLFTTGSLVHLSNGEVAKVVSTSDNPMLFSMPVVRAVMGSDGSSAGGLLDLSQEEAAGVHVTSLVSLGKEAVASHSATAEYEDADEDEDEDEDEDGELEFGEIDEDELYDGARDSFTDLELTGPESGGLNALTSKPAPGDALDFPSEEDSGNTEAGPVSDLKSKAPPQRMRGVPASRKPKPFAAVMRSASPPATKRGGAASSAPSSTAPPPKSAPRSVPAPKFAPPKSSPPKSSPAVSPPSRPAPPMPGARRSAAPKGVAPKSKARGAGVRGAGVRGAGVRSSAVPRSAGPKPDATKVDDALLAYLSDMAPESVRPQAQAPSSPAPITDPPKEVLPPLTPPPLTPSPFDTSAIRRPGASVSGTPPPISPPVRTPISLPGRDLGDIKPTASGKLSKTPLVHLLVYAIDRKLTGTTGIVEPNGDVHLIYFDNGVASKVRTAGTIHPLDEVLRDMGAVTPSTLKQSLLEIAESGQLHGQHLIERDQLDHVSLLAALQWQLQRKVSHMLSLSDDCRYAYYDNVNALADYGGLELTPVDPLALIMTGLRMMASRSLVSSALARLAPRPLKIRSSANIERLKLSRDEFAVAQALRERPTPLTELVADRPGGQRTTLLTIYALMITRSLDVGLMQKPPVGSEIPPIEERWPQIALEAKAPIEHPPSTSSKSASAAPTTAPFGMKKPAGGTAPVTHTSPTEPPPEPVRKPLELDGLAPPGTPAPSPSPERARAVPSAKAPTPKRRSIAGHSATLISREPGSTPAPEPDAPIDPYRFFKKAQIKLMTGKLNEAEDLVQQAVDAAPDEPEYIAMLAWIQADILGPPEALAEGQSSDHYSAQVALIDRALSHDEKYAKALFYRAELLRMSGHLERALDDYKRVAELDPHNEDAAQRVNELDG